MLLPPQPAPSGCTHFCTLPLPYTHTISATPFDTTVCLAEFQHQLHYFEVFGDGTGYFKVMQLVLEVSQEDSSIERCSVGGVGARRLGSIQTWYAGLCHNR